MCHRVWSIPVWLGRGEEGRGLSWHRRMVCVLREVMRCGCWQWLWNPQTSPGEHEPVGRALDWVRWISLCSVTHFTGCSRRGQLNFLDLVCLSLNWESWNNMVCSLPSSSAIQKFQLIYRVRWPGTLLPEVSLHSLQNLAQWPGSKHEPFRSSLDLPLFYFCQNLSSCLSIPAVSLIWYVLQNLYAGLLLVFNITSLPLCHKNLFYIYSS